MEFFLVIPGIQMGMKTAGIFPVIPGIRMEMILDQPDPTFFPWEKGAGISLAPPAKSMGGFLWNPGMGSGWE